MTDTIIFRPYLTTAIKHFLFHTCVLAVLLYSWNHFGSWIYLTLAVIPLFGVVCYGTPLICLPHVAIGEDKTITIRYWFDKGYTEKISKALYEILVIENDEIRSYRFNIRGNLFQVSPCVYERGDDLITILEPFTRKNRVSIKSTILG